MELSLTDIKSLYTNDLTLNQISKKYDISVYKLKKFMLDKGIKIRKKGSKYHFNEDVFEKIDNEDKAYWLGFIYADGCVMKKKGGSDILSITLKIDDYVQLYNFCDFLNLNNKKVALYRDVCRLEVSSNKIVKDLINHGVLYRKTFQLNFPNIDNLLIKHFIRGYFDGDGSITVNDKNVIFKLIGTENFIKGVQRYFMDTLKLTEVKLIIDSNMFNYYKNGRKQVTKIMEHLYTDKCTNLERKYSVANKLLIK